MELNGQRLSLAELSAVARGMEQVSLAPAARARIEESRRVIEQIIAENRTVYGVNTGFGKLSDVRIDPSQIRDLQLNLCAVIHAVWAIRYRSKKRGRCFCCARTFWRSV
jgi:histidine ammonia-lyase